MRILLSQVICERKQVLVIELNILNPFIDRFFCCFVNLINVHVRANSKGLILFQLIYLFKELDHFLDEFRELLLLLESKNLLLNIKDFFFH